MITTFINDRKLSDYPFCKLEEPRPFPPGCITYLGVCIHGAEDGYPLFASAISISMDGVLVSICKELSDTTSETVGSIYVTADKDSAGVEISNSTVHCNINMMIDRSMLQNSFGNYNGKFYLDPACVTYMSDSVYGAQKGLVINGSTYTADSHVNFSCAGDLLKLTEPVADVTGTTCTTYLKASADVNEYALTDSMTVSESPVQAVNTIQIPTGDTTQTYPMFGILPDPESNAVTMVASGSTTEPADLILEIWGNTDFPNCYKGKGDQA